ncbi:uncharacterized protein LOC144142356 isoform X3 [Haemaphysalis longicornis]
MDASAVRPYSLNTARAREALSRRRQAESDHPADIARRAAARERARKAKRAKLASETEEERDVRLAKRREWYHNRKQRLSLDEFATTPIKGVVGTKEQEDPAVAAPAEVDCGGRVCWSQAAQAVIATAARGSQCNQRLVTRAIACQTDFPDGVDGPAGAGVASRQGAWSSSCCSRLDGRGSDVGAHEAGGGDGVTVHRCVTCRKRFSYKDSLLRHMLSPSCCKPFVCGRCHRGFSRQSDLAEHERVRTACRLYKCRVCGQDFAHCCNLVRHEVRFHWDARCHVCRLCGQSFGRREQLEEHERSHTSHKPYACRVCGKSYTVRSSLVRHERKHRAQELGAAARSAGARVSPSPSEELVAQGQVATGHEDLPSISPPCVMLVTLGLGPISP